MVSDHLHDPAFPRPRGASVAFVQIDREVMPRFPDRPASGSRDPEGFPRLVEDPSRLTPKKSIPVLSSKSRKNRWRGDPPAIPDDLSHRNEASKTLIPCFEDENLNIDGLLLLGENRWLESK